MSFIHQITAAHFLPELIAACAPENVARLRPDGEGLESLMRVKNALRQRATVKPLARASVERLIAKYADEAGAAPVRFGGRAAEVDDNSVTVTVFAPWLIRSAAAFMIELATETQCALVDVSHLRVVSVAALEQLLRPS